MTGHCEGGGLEAAGEAELVAIGIQDVEVALAPFCVARRGLGIKTSREGSIIKRIDIGYVVYDPSPPGPTLAGPRVIRLRNPVPA